MKNKIVCMVHPSCRLISYLYYFPKAAIANYYKDLKEHKFIILHFCGSEVCSKSLWAEIDMSSTEISSFLGTQGLSNSLSFPASSGCPHFWSVASFQLQRRQWLAGPFSHYSNIGSFYILLLVLRALVITLGPPG